MRNINDLHPALRLLIKHLRYKFPDIGVGECVRTVEEQNKLYEQGRTTPGSIVTNVRGDDYMSQHQWGIAFDFFKNVKGHEYDDETFFKQIGAYVKRLGFGWGGNWTSPVDMPHVYIKTWGDTPKELKRLYGKPDNFFKSAKYREMLHVDGYLGTNTISALELFFDVVPDGELSKPSQTIMRLQQFLTDNREEILK